MAYVLIMVHVVYAVYAVYVPIVVHVVHVVHVVDVVWRVLFRSGACWTVLLRVAPLLSAFCPLECNRHAMLP